MQFLKSSAGHVGLAGMSRLSIPGPQKSLVCYILLGFKFRYP